MCEFMTVYVYVYNYTVTCFYFNDHVPPLSSNLMNLPRARVKLITGSLYTRYTRTIKQRCGLEFKYHYIVDSTRAIGHSNPRCAARTICAFFMTHGCNLIDLSNIIGSLPDKHRARRAAMDKIYTAQPFKYDETHC